MTARHSMTEPALKRDWGHLYPPGHWPNAVDGTLDHHRCDVDHAKRIIRLT